MVQPAVSYFAPNQCILQHQATLAWRHGSILHEPQLNQNHLSRATKPSPCSLGRNSSCRGRSPSFFCVTTPFAQHAKHAGWLLLFAHRGKAGWPHLPDNFTFFLHLPTPQLHKLVNVRVAWNRDCKQWQHSAWSLLMNGIKRQELLILHVPVLSRKTRLYF